MPDTFRRISNGPTALDKPFRRFVVSSLCLFETTKRPNDQTTKRPNDQTTMKGETEMNNAFRTLLFSTLLLSSTAFAQSSDIGQVDLKPIGDAIGVTPKVNLNFGPAMMKGFAESFRGSNAELAGIIDSISGLRLMVFENVDASGARDQVERTVGDLGNAGWTPAMEVRDGDTHVDLFLNESENFVEGLVLMVLDGEDTAVFANIYGDIDPVVIGKLIGSGDALNGVSFEDLAGQFQSMSGGSDDDSGDEG